MKKRIWLVIGCLVIGLIAVSSYYFYRNMGNKTQTSLVVKKRTANIVAIGDSLTYGVGDESEHGYVGQIKDKLSKQKNLKIVTHNYGISGERSDQINKRIGNEAKLQTNLKKANIIVLTVGGNDLFQNFQKVLFTSSTNGAEQRLSVAQTAYKQKLLTLMSSIRKYNLTAPIFVFSIYNPFYVYFSNVSLINQTVSNWNGTTKNVVNGTAGAHFIDINKTLSDGQYDTPAKRAALLTKNQSANDGELSLQQIENIESNKSEANKYISDVDNFHPNKRGYQQMTTALYKSLRKNISWIGADN
ncbi:GDSL-type esterase/lipase family protein [Pediococcus claussenii]|uniref:GDSL-like Lipase/Acylhydrolase family protein n=1 Tax=Pediococcus claussenii (strain ATCC BAA-344 / DSM 14800 / JCM 18046 / KCTC 3811 / LMG 21948 / P06) TaxID=701521 RepID=G8PD54_PEDCP|nr:GDSL-type esterase/lipase family protein [Pediococcus claussenii]AEV95189.1 GDSL-like Lipase/Acylhydrolase family protein [Pediococcus claussenii ATCC BAA-344]ANZ70420.1 hypothetical protein AYR57_08865 [Pediococcus claussenii]ANZ72236.1 hypothetical protein AYR58_08865 [Pediococcus claussenii]KRN19628.1 hypothetical protein IV79_GL001345 [Pediococcus claussenii]